MLKLIKSFLKKHYIILAIALLINIPVIVIGTYRTNNTMIKDGDLVLFDYPIKDYNIKKGEALFIDDLESNLDAAVEKGFDVLLNSFKKGSESPWTKLLMLL